MRLARYITHPDVVIDPAVPVPRWPLSERGRARMRRLVNEPWVAELRHVFSSEEQKAIDGAEILAEASGAVHRVLAELHENDRSATGFLPPDEFWPTVDQFFANPEQSVRGWERAVDARDRVLRALRAGLEQAGSEPAAFVAHGGVGALLLGRLRDEPISRGHEQPGPPAGSPAGSGGGYYFTFDATSLRVTHGWRPIDSR